MENIDKAVRTSTTPEEKRKRFDFINNQLMEKYFELVWFARSNPDKARNNGEKELFETLTQKLGEISDKYPKEIQALCGDDSNWEHGFNSGILAYSRFLADYVSDMLFPDDDDLEDAIVLDGKKYIQIDG